MCIAVSRRRSWRGLWSNPGHRHRRRFGFFMEEAEARCVARDLARTFPQVEVVPFESGHAVLADGCPYLTNGQVSVKPMPTG